MAPVVKALAQSESKSRFMERLGLNEHNPDHKHIYHMMKEEASAGRKRIMATPNVLRSNSLQHAQPPFSNAQVSETAMHREILNIYRHSRPETRYFYDMGRDTQGLEEENWVIRWLLWHVFRYRDNRNKHRRQESSGRGSPSSSENSSSETPGSNGSSGASSGASSANLGGNVSSDLPNRRIRYDPVRDT